MGGLSGLPQPGVQNKAPAVHCVAYIAVGKRRTGFCRHPVFASISPDDSFFPPLDPQL